MHYPFQRTLRKCKTGTMSWCPAVKQVALKCYDLAIFIMRLISRKCIAGYRKRITRPVFKKRKLFCNGCVGHYRLRLESSCRCAVISYITRRCCRNFNAHRGKQRLAILVYSKVTDISLRLR